MFFIMLCFVVSFIVECSPECENGGYCTEPDICDCANTGYTGNSCETRMLLIEMPPYIVGIKYQYAFFITKCD